VAALQWNDLPVAKVKPGKVKSSGGGEQQGCGAGQPGSTIHQRNTNPGATGEGSNDNGTGDSTMKNNSTPRRIRV